MNFWLLTITVLVLATTVYAEDCNPANICFAMDESGSISSADFTIEKDVVNQMAQDFAARASSASFSAVGFDNVASVVSNPTTDLALFQSAISNNPQSGGGTASGSALTLCSSLLANSADPRIIVLLTDGRDNTGIMGVSVSDDIKMDGTMIITIGIGNDVLPGDLQEIASRPEFFIYETDFQALMNDVSNLVDEICEVSMLVPQSVCGTSWEDAGSKCMNACRDDSGCPNGERCWASIPCGPLNPLPPTGSKCGIDWVDAGKCETSCASDADCPDGEHCFADISCSATKTINKSRASRCATKRTLNKRTTRGCLAQKCVRA